MASKHSHHSRFFSTQFVTSCISTTLVLVLLGTIVLFVLTARNLSAFVRENINVTLLLSDDLDSLASDALRSDLAARPYVKEIRHVTKEDAREEYTRTMGADPTEFIDHNPFMASFEIKMNAAYANNDSLSRIVRELKDTPDVAEVLYQKELMQSVNDNIRKVSAILLVIAALFTYISFELINNTIRLTIFSKRFLINTMKLVGAPWGFIRRPFLRQALALGFVSAVAADALIYLGIEWLRRFEPEIRTVVTPEVAATVGAAVLVFGLLITLLCTYVSLGKYLRMSSNELYHI